MNQSINSIMIAYCSASVIYFIYAMYMEYTKKTLYSALSNYPELQEKYKNIKKKHIGVFIMGLLIGFVIVILLDNNDTCNETSGNINTIDDIHVRY